MITIQLNNQLLTVKLEMSLQEILIDQGYQQDGFAVMINRNFVPSPEHHCTLLHSGDQIDIIFPMQGG